MKARISLMVLLVLLSACAAKQTQVAYTGLSMSAEFIDVVNKSVESSWKAGELSRDQLEEISGLTHKWTSSHNAAVQALEIAIQTQDPDKKVQAIKLATEADKMFITIWELLKTWNIKVGGGS